MKNNNTPEIRFSGFAGPWEQLNLSDVSKVITKGTTPKDRSNEGDINFIKVENIDSSSGVITVTSRISKEEHEGYLKRSQLELGDILFSIAGTLGRVTIVTDEVLPANTNQALAIIRLKEGNVAFIATYLKGKSVKDYIRKNPTVGAQPNLSLKQVGELIINNPNNQEQERIGTFFKQLDKTIALFEQELTLLKQTKKGFLQKMFPKEGESVPEIRFPGFTGDWEQRKLGELAEVRTGKAFSSADFSDDGEYLVVTNKNIQDEANGITSVGDRINITEETILKNYLLSGENILVTMDGVNIGKTGKYSNEKAVLAQRVGRLNSEQLEFVYQITSNSKFVSEMNKLSVGNAIKHISLKQISDYSFLAPISEEEQEKIGTFFKQQDSIIALHLRELDALKEIKKAFLQKMFI